MSLLDDINRGREANREAGQRASAALYQFGASAKHLSSHLREIAKHIEEARQRLRELRFKRN